MLKPYGQLPEDDAYAAFREQAAILAEGGVDGFIIETMFDLREAVCALRGAKEAATANGAGTPREAGDLPIIASIAFGAEVVASDVYREGITGVTAADIAPGARATVAWKS